MGPRAGSSATRSTMPMAPHPRRSAKLRDLMEGEDPPEKPDRLLERLSDLELEQDRVSRETACQQKRRTSFSNRHFWNMLAAVLLGPFIPFMLVRGDSVYSMAIVGLLIWGVWLFAASMKVGLI